MSIAEISRSLVYSTGQITLGLLLHPYQTMQSLVADKVFVWMTMLPTGLLAVITMIWRYGFVPLIQTMFTCHSSTWLGVGCGVLPLFAYWIIFFCVYWQLLLFYLLIRFSRVF